MIFMTQAEPLELVEELRSVAAAHPTAKVCDVLYQLADRYAAGIRGRHEAFSKPMMEGRQGAREGFYHRRVGRRLLGRSASAAI